MRLKNFSSTIFLTFISIGFWYSIYQQGGLGNLELGAIAYVLLFALSSLILFIIDMFINKPYPLLVIVNAVVFILVTYLIIGEMIYMFGLVAIWGNILGLLSGFYLFSKKS